jgi:hypothetical protein
MKVAAYKWTNYNIKHLEAAERQIDRVWEANGQQIVENWLSKIQTDGKAPINRTVEGLQADFKRRVLKEMSVQFGGKNKVESDVNVNIAIERVLRSTAYQDRDTAAKTNLLSRLDGSKALREIQKLDPSITLQDIIDNAQYVPKTSDTIDFDGIGQLDVKQLAKASKAKTIDEDFDEVYNTVFSYRHNGYMYFFVQDNSDSPSSWHRVKIS